MSKSTISTFELFALFPDVETARTYLEGRLWPNGPTCPVCGLGERITARKGGFYRCNQCREDFTVRTGTIFERSHVPLHKWVYAMYLLVTARKGISSLQLSKEIGITQKSAWFVLHRLREACGGDLEKLQGIVEIDETYVGGLEKNKHEADKLKLGRGPVGKTAVLGMKERGKGGRVKGIKIDATDAQTIQDQIVQNVEIGSTLHTDEHLAYTGMGGLFFNHDTINHSQGEYVRDGVTTNSIESVFAVLKRGLIGVYHHASPKHLSRYVDEFAFRLNDGNVARHTMERLDSFVKAVAGKRLTYKALIA
ncbi:MAG: IS1595 family transposase [Xanthobacteraceae bacterium]|nr:IS1595 family transposase [Xanthobacteraceae bacterium]